MSKHNIPCLKHKSVHLIINKWTKTVRLCKTSPAQLRSTKRGVTVTPFPLKRGRPKTACTSRAIFIGRSGRLFRKFRSKRRLWKDIGLRWSQQTLALIWLFACFCWWLLIHRQSLADATWFRTYPRTNTWTSHKTWMLLCCTLQRVWSMCIEILPKEEGLGINLFDFLFGEANHDVDDVGCLWHSSMKCSNIVRSNCPKQESSTQ